MVGPDDGLALWASPMRGIISLPPVQSEKLDIVDCPSPAKASGVG